MIRRKALSVLVLIILPALLWSFEPKGPLRSKNYYVPFIPFYSFPGEGAAAGEKGALNLTLAQYYIQDMVAEFHTSSTGLLKERFIDYEGYILEPGVSFNPLNDLEAGVTARLHFYYGGIFDSVFEGFHDLFGFPNGGRESYGRDEVFINIHTTSGIDLFLDEPLAAPGDTDLFVKWTFLSLRSLDLALWGALKIPTGSMETISGSGYADLAFSLLADFHFLRRFAFYLETGLVIPGQLLSGHDKAPLPIFHLMAGSEFMVTERLSLLLLFKLNTSPIAEDVTVPENISYTTKLVLPMTNILFGVIWEAGPLRVQFNMEEDAFTNNGADLIANLTLSTSFDLY
ncbi:MAG: DUF3187 family protein [Spirochaetales bacterium]|nr:DUF3187 family protein [Spirochaetales bacterium]